MNLPTNKDELITYLLARSKEINEERPKMEKGAAYINGFNDGMKYANSQVTKEAKGFLSSLNFNNLFGGRQDDERIN